MPEFDDYAADYARLLRDPVRSRFAGKDAFFQERKCILIRDFFRRRRAATSSLSWLDIGCGQGELIRAAGRDFARAVGCDPSSGMIENCGVLNLVKQPGPTSLPFPDASFDFVTAVCVYHHTHGAERRLLTQAARRVLKPHGVFCMIEHNPWNPVTKLIVKRCPVDRDAELLNVRESAEMVRSAGFAVLQTSFFLYLPERLFRAAPWVERWLEWCPAGGQYALFASREDLRQ